MFEKNIHTTVTKSFLKTSCQDLGLWFTHQRSGRNPGCMVSRKCCLHLCWNSNSCPFSLTWETTSSAWDI